MTQASKLEEKFWLREKAMLINTISEHLYGEDHLLSSCTDEQREGVACFILSALPKGRSAQISEELYQAKVDEGWKQLVAVARRLHPAEWIAVRELLAGLKDKKPTEGVPA